MLYLEDELNRIYDRGRGKCWFCGRKLAYKNYGIPNARAAWEVSNSIPPLRGATRNKRNLVPSCMGCLKKGG